eukprot:m.158829 g.158829  ORF g.158829 m.158829 type:complete len:97 (+) comp17985_c0_seq1:71-361(+)
MNLAEHHLSPLQYSEVLVSWFRSNIFSAVKLEVLADLVNDSPLFEDDQELTVLQAFTTLESTNQSLHRDGRAAGNPHTLAQPLSSQVNRLLRDTHM